MSKGLKLTPYIPEIQKNVDIFGGELEEVKNYEGLFTFTNTALDGEEIICVFTSKPSSDIDKVAHVLMGLNEAFSKTTKEGEYIKIDIEVILGDLNKKPTEYNKEILIQDLNSFYSMNIIGNKNNSVYQMRFLDYLDIDKGFEFVEFNISQAFRDKQKQKKVRNMPTAPLIETKSKYTRSLYRYLHSNGGGNNKLADKVRIQEVEQYLGIEDTTNNNKNKILSRAFKEIQTLTGHQYKRLRKRGIFNRIKTCTSEVKKVNKPKKKAPIKEEPYKAPKKPQEGFKDDIVTYIPDDVLEPSEASIGQFKMDAYIGLNGLYNVLLDDGESVCLNTEVLDTTQYNLIPNPNTPKVGKEDF